MARKIHISEEQHRYLMQEGVTLNADVAAAHGDVNQAIKNTKEQARKDGVDIDNATISINAKDNNENQVIITGRRLRESRLRALQSNGKHYTVRDFMSRIR